MSTFNAASILELERLRSKIAELSEKEDTLVGKVKKDFRKRLGRKFRDGDEEFFAPLDCAYKFALRVNNRSSVPWRDEWFELAMKRYGDKGAVNREKSLMKKSRKPVAALKVEKNEKYIKEKR